jgi:hypothetical protein
MFWKHWNHGKRDTKFQTLNKRKARTTNSLATLEASTLYIFSSLSHLICYQIQYFLKPHFENSKLILDWKLWKIQDILSLKMQSKQWMNDDKVIFFNCMPKVIFLYVRYIYWLMSIILNIVINFFNKRENISLGFLIYLLYLNNFSFNQIIFFYIRFPWL